MTGEMLDLGPVEIDEFALWWSVYPRHKDKARAEAAYRRARRVASAEAILNATREYAAQVTGLPASQQRWAIEFLRAQPWVPVEPSPAPAPRAQRRRANTRPKRAARRKAPARKTLAELQEERKAAWCHARGITVDVYESRKGDSEWLERMKAL